MGFLARNPRPSPNRSIIPTEAGGAAGPIDGEAVDGEDKAAAQAASANQPNALLTALSVQFSVYGLCTRGVRIVYVPCRRKTLENKALTPDSPPYQRTGG